MEFIRKLYETCQTMFDAENYGNIINCVLNNSLETCVMVLTVMVLLHTY